MPARSIERFANVATPPTALTVVVPPSVPPLGFVAIAMPIEAELTLTLLPYVSRTPTVTAGLIAAAAVTFVGC